MFHHSLKIIMAVFIVFAVLALTIKSYEAGLVPLMGPVGTMLLSKLEPCPKSPKLLEVAFGKDAQGRKVWDIKVNAPEDLDEKATIQAIIYKCSGSNCKRNVFKYSGPICEYVNKYAPIIRERAYKLAGISGICAVKKGSYTMKGMHALEKEVEVPIIPYGKFKIEITVMNAAKKSIGCFIVTSESKPK